ncbi:hypothetical protein PAECIP111892_04094 [Paenibacillus auburnensis]|jgi:hypothetical protein|uniref:DUF1648 domain-containing protein n=1 Tax=Paenibacillus auburnensis TaxID=2905649 RepID=A0ABM9CKB8_9BACL|nr:DUF1648 domain-containing protein [Paenibacillus auburnensis]CAH1215494.1 hypothetical protein PAECIP111892_04094 [Paenibacillus auburnensis]
MFKNKITLTLSSIAAIIPVLLYMYLYRQMPDFVPIHYNGEVADRFVDKGSYEVLLVSLFGWLSFGFIRLLQLLLRRLFLRSYIENLALNHQIWNAATLLVTVGFSVISVFALLAMV